MDIPEFYIIVNKIDININLTYINKIGELVWKNESMDISN